MPSGQSGPSLARRKDGLNKKRKSLRRGPGKHWESKPAVIIRGEREICNPVTIEGRAEYKWRTMLAWVRQDGWCCFWEYEFCPGRLKLAEATMEHENKRGAGKHDSRLWDDRTHRPMNGAAHGSCNGIAGSRRLPLFYGDKCTVELEAM